MVYTRTIIRNLSHLSEQELKEIGLDLECLARSLQEVENKLNKLPSYRRLQTRSQRLGQKILS